MEHLRPRVSASALQEERNAARMTLGWRFSTPAIRREFVYLYLAEPERLSTSDINCLSLKGAGNAV